MSIIFVVFFLQISIHYWQIYIPCFSNFKKQSRHVRFLKLIKLFFSYFFRTANEKSIQLVEWSIYSRDEWQMFRNWVFRSDDKSQQDRNCLSKYKYALSRGYFIILENLIAYICLWQNQHRATSGLHVICVSLIASIVCFKCGTAHELLLICDWILMLYYNRSIIGLLVFSFYFELSSSCWRGTFNGFLCPFFKF